MSYYPDLDPEENFLSDPCIGRSGTVISAASSDAAVDTTLGSSRDVRKPTGETTEIGSDPFPNECPLLFQVINHVVSDTRRHHSICSLPRSQKLLLNKSDNLLQEDVSEFLRELNQFIRSTVEDSFRSRSKLQDLLPFSPLLQEDTSSSTVCGTLHDTARSQDDRTFIKDILFTFYSLEDDGVNPWSKESHPKGVNLNKYEGDTEPWHVFVFDKEEKPNEDGLEDREGKQRAVSSAYHIESNYSMTVPVQIPNRKISPHFAKFISLFLLLLLLASLFLIILQSQRNIWFRNPIQPISDSILGAIHLVLLTCKTYLLCAVEVSGMVSSPASHLARARFLSS